MRGRTGYLDEVQKLNLIDGARQACSSSSVVYNMTLTFKKTYDDIQSWDMEKFVEPIFKIGLTSKKLDIQWFVLGAYESFPNTKTRAHVHCQLYIATHLEDVKQEIILNDVINKLHGILNKKLGNTKIAKNLSRKKFDAFKTRLGIPIHDDSEYTEYYHYMYKNTIHKRELFKLN